MSTKMKKIILQLAMAAAVFPAAAQTLEECQQAAAENYPLIKRYGLIEKTTGLTIANLQKGWLPQVQAVAQGTLQSDVMAWPGQMQDMLEQMNIRLKGLQRGQYRVGIDVNQTVYDGGNIRSQKEIGQLQGDVQAAQTGVDLYPVRKRVNELYFGLLLIDERIRINADLQTLLAANEKKLASMLRNGTAAESDYNAVRAERLNAKQQLTELQAQRQMLRRMLSLFTGIEVENVAFPAEQQLPDGTNRRPELSLIDMQLRLADAQEKALHAALMPKLSVFAQGYYGYPGYNMFDDMLHHRPTLNGMIGARLTWNIGTLYTHKNDRSKLDATRQMFNVQRETFLFNNRLEQVQQNENIARYRQLMADDDEIISIRQSVRKAAESKLAHGIIDVNDLLKEITSENEARIRRSTHEIELQKEIHDLKYTTNN